MQTDQGSKRVTASLLAITGAVVLGMIATFGAAAASGAATRESPAATANKEPLSYFVTHPCALVTAGELASVYHAKVTDQAVDGLCLYQSKAEHNVIQITLIPTSDEKESTLPKVTNEPSVGHGAFCQTVYGHVDVFAVGGKVNGVSKDISVQAATCAQAVEVAKIAFSHLS